METSTAVASAAVLLVLLCSLLQTPAALASGSGKPPPPSSYVVYLGGHPQRDDGVSPEVASRRAADSHYDLLGAVLGQ